MRRWKLFAVVLVLLGAIAIVVRMELSKTAPDIRPGFLKHHDEAAAMCPWREPDADMHSFFPGSTAYHTQFLAFSHDRLRIMRLLGPDVDLMNTSLYIHHVVQGTRARGAIVVQRVAGPHGALEVVVGLGTDGRIAGARVQRLREPDKIAEVITSPKWLNGFHGKSSGSPMRVGNDVPSVPAAALPAAETVARAIRTLVIETDFALFRKS